MWRWATLALADALGSEAAPYSPAAAARALGYARATYCPAVLVASWTCERCKEVPALSRVRIVSNSSEKTLAYVGSDPTNAVVIGFRGTVDLDVANWVEDFDVAHVKPWLHLPSVSVHRGFFNAWRSLHDGVFAAVRELLAETPNRQITVVGHSLGASMACLCAFDLILTHRVPVTSVYTFGQPRTGNRAFAELYNSYRFDNWRVTHDRDPVPELPWENLGYQHTDGEAFYNGPCSSYVVCLNVTDGRCARTFNPLIMRPSDHSRYLNLSLGGGDCDTEFAPSSQASLDGRFS